MANNQNLKPFVKGDPRINRKGRPKSFDALRKLAQQISTEIVNDKNTGQAWSRVELILRSWSTSSNPQLAGRFMEIAYGKVPDEINIKSKEKITVKMVEDDGS